MAGNPPGVDFGIDQFGPEGAAVLDQFGGVDGDGGGRFFLNVDGTPRALPGGFSAGQVGGAPGGLRGTTGSISSVTADGITLTTAQGEVKVQISATTSAQTVTDSLLSSFAEGDQVTVRGQRQADGTITAVQISRTGN